MPVAVTLYNPFTCRAILHREIRHTGLFLFPYEENQPRALHMPFIIPVRAYAVEKLGPLLHKFIKVLRGADEIMVVLIIIALIQHRVSILDFDVHNRVVLDSYELCGFIMLIPDILGEQD